MQLSDQSANMTEMTFKCTDETRYEKLDVTNYHLLKGRVTQKET
jgi:hypothetical protein